MKTQISLRSEIQIELPSSVAFQVSKIRSIINANKKLSTRKNLIIEAGFFVKEVPMGSGGVGQVKQMKDHFRVQIESGHGSDNYADAVIITK